jgi:hypothetical protein
MAEDDGEKRKALIQVSDLFGVSKGADRLVQAIERGLGNFFAPYQKRRLTDAEISTFRKWRTELRKAGLEASTIDLSLDDRAVIRVYAEQSRKQENRETIAIEAAHDYRNHCETIDVETPADQQIESEWLDRFWRLAEDVSSSDMQAVWGRILSRQAGGVYRYSARCLETLSLISREEAQELIRLSTFVSSAVIEGTPHYHILQYLSLGTRTDHLNKFNDRMSERVGRLRRDIFGPAGIFLDSGSGWAQDISVQIENGTANLTIAKKLYRLKYDSKTDSTDYIGGGVGISPIGAEIFSLIDSVPDAEYLAALSESLASMGIKVVPA